MNEFQILKESRDIIFLEKELENAKNKTPECTAENLYLLNKIGIILDSISKIKR